MARHPEVEATGGFWLFLGALLLAAPLSLALEFLGACVLHELGHWGAIRALGGGVAALRLTGAGAVMVPGGGRICSYGEECLTALAGPAASLLLALAGGLAGLDRLAAVSLALGLFNLLPAWPLDGGRVLGAALAWGWGPDLARWGTAAVSGAVGLALVGAGLWLLPRTGNPLLLVWGGWLLLGRLWGGGPSAA